MTSFPIVSCMGPAIRKVRGCFHGDPQSLSPKAVWGGAVTPGDPACFIICSRYRLGNRAGRDGVLLVILQPRAAVSVPCCQAWGRPAIAPRNCICPEPAEKGQARAMRESAAQLPAKAGSCCGLPLCLQSSMALGSRPPSLRIHKALLLCCKERGQDLAWAGMTWDGP